MRFRCVNAIVSHFKSHLVDRNQLKDKLSPI